MAIANYDIRKGEVTNFAQHHDFLLQHAILLPQKLSNFNHAGRFRFHLITLVKGQF